MERGSEIRALFILGFINRDQFIQHICIYSRALYYCYQSCINRDYFFADYVYYYGPDLFKRKNRMDEVVRDVCLYCRYTFSFIKR